MTDTAASFFQPLDAVWRAADELRRAGAVVLEHAPGQGGLLMLALERVDSDLLRAFDTLAHASNSRDRLLISNRRAEVLKIGSKGREAVALDRESWMEAPDMVQLADPSSDYNHFLKGPFARLEPEDSVLEAAALRLLKRARLLPAALVRWVPGPIAGALTVSPDLIDAAGRAESDGLKVVARANLPVKGADKAQLVAFRAQRGGAEHMAFIIGSALDGKPDPLVRLHSECFTGDLLGSLKCDCGVQLNGALGAMIEAGGGVLLYLAQEGRGIGLMSKLKAYSLQDQGLDTVDANLRLGFDTDERDFAPAAKMLDLLGINSIRLMTNNPNKVAGLEERGVAVAERVAHQFPTNPHNQDYLATKKSRTGHLLHSDLIGKGSEDEHLA